MLCLSKASLCLCSIAHAPPHHSSTTPTHGAVVADAAVHASMGVSPCFAVWSEANTSTTGEEKPPSSTHRPRTFFGWRLLRPSISSVSVQPSLAVEGA